VTTPGAEDVLGRLAAALAAAPGRRVAVAVDGPDAAGKTTLADRLAEVLPVPAVRASSDGFAAPPAVRHRRGRLSPEGCYRDGSDLTSLTQRLLVPFLAGAPTVVTSVRDARRDDTTVVEVDVLERAVLVVDGVFLLRPELRGHWTLSVHLHVSAAESLRRGVARDAALMGSADAVEQRYRRRYLPAQDLYRAECDPLAVADVVLDMSDPAGPAVLAWRCRQPARRRREGDGRAGPGALDRGEDERPPSWQ